MAHAGKVLVDEVPENFEKEIVQKRNANVLPQKSANRNNQSKQNKAGVVKAKTQIVSKRLTMTIYPNPARDYFVVNINSFVFGKVILQVLNEPGKVVFTKDAYVSVGLNATTISERKKLTGGNYTVQLVSGKEVYNHDLVVL